MFFAVVDLLWCIPHTRPLLPDNWHIFLFPAAILFAFVAYNYLDYLFSRAIGGFFILLAYYFLPESFSLHSPAAPIFAIFCFCMGTAGIFFSGKPFLLRDFIRKAADSVRFKIASAAFAMAFGLFSLVLGIVHLTGMAAK